MTTYSVADAKNNLPKLIDRALRRLRAVALGADAGFSAEPMPLPD